MINEVKGEEALWRNIVELDYPDFKPAPMKGTWTHGKFHETLKEIEEKTGATHYNVKMEFFSGMFCQYGVLDEDGKCITLCNLLNHIGNCFYLLEYICVHSITLAITSKCNLDTCRWLSPEKKQEILDARAHEDTIIPPGFTPQPENQGKILFLSGPPGAGKSTTAQYLAKQKGWVYYEADCFANSVNPFIPLDEDEPSMAQMKQKAIKGRDIEMVETIKDCFPEFEKMVKNMPYDAELVKPFFRTLAKDIVKHKQRLGGNFAVAQAVPTRVFRDCIKEIFGPQGIFVVLRLAKETNAKRVAGRHAGGDPETLKKMLDFMNGIYDTYEDAQPGEDNCIMVEIGPEDSREDVMNKILKQVEDLEAASSKS